MTGLVTYHDDPPPTIVRLMYGEETRNRFTRSARLTQDAVDDHPPHRERLAP